MIDNKRDRDAPVPEDVNDYLTNAQSVESLRDVADYLYPSLIALIISFVGIILTATVVMKERTSDAFFRNIISPAPDYIFLLGTYITVLLVR